ncbi:MAG: prephenate dehydratase [Candidatus Limnocylindrales bacterium]
MTRIAFAGERGAFAEDAVLSFDPSAEAVPVPGFREAFEAVDAGRLPADRPGAASVGAAALPIENLVNGTVRETYDLLLEHDLVIVGEAIVPVRLCLAALPGETLASVERVYSHVQALGQAEAFLRSRPWLTMSTYNTAGAGRLIAERRERGAAAVLSPRAAALFGLEILADGIQSVPDNRTRFLIVARRGTPAALARQPGGEGPRRTTLVFAVRNEPGTLLRALGAFAERGVNLSSLESRPSRSAAWEYVFWTDLDADVGEAGCRAAIDELRTVSTMVRVLGSYARVSGG